jgi:hypothetical protein
MGHHVKLYEEFDFLKKKLNLDKACWWMIDKEAVKISILNIENDNIAFAYAAVTGFKDYDKHFFSPCTKNDNEKIKKYLKSRIYKVSNIDEDFIYFIKRNNKTTPLKYKILSNKTYDINYIKKYKK